MRVVIDTGVFVSALIRREGRTGDVLRALSNGRFSVIYSVNTLIEVIDVLGRSSFRIKYNIEMGDITALVNLIRLSGELVTPIRSVCICRDAKDDKFLEAALEGIADCIVTGDADLLVLEKFEGIPIYRPVDFLAIL